MVLNNASFACESPEESERVLEVKSYWFGLPKCLNQLNPSSLNLFGHAHF